MDSAQVRLEVAILAADQIAPVMEPVIADQSRTILLIGGDDETCEQIRDRLGGRTDIRLVVAPTVASLLALAKVDAEIAKLLG